MWPRVKPSPSQWWWKEDPASKAVKKLTVVSQMLS
jgi:hypothetical protein